MCLFHGQIWKYVRGILAEHSCNIMSLRLRALIEMYWTYLYEFSFQYLLKLCKQIVNVNLLLLKFKLLSVI